MVVGASIAYVVCSSGLGHFKRAVTIGHELQRRRPLDEATLLCAPWQVESVGDWEPLARWIEGGLTVRTYESPLVWRSAESYYGPWLLSLFDESAALHLHEHDLVVTDNAVEPVAFARNAVIVGSFLWHEVLREAFPLHEDVEAYWHASEDLLADRRPVAIVNKYFAMPRLAMREEVRAVGLVSFHGQREKRLGALDVLIAPGSAALDEMEVDQISAAAHKLVALGGQLHATEPWRNRFTDQGLTCDLFDFASDSMQGFAWVLARAGMGTVSDAVSQRVPLLLLSSDNPELRHNAEVCRSLAIGEHLVNALDDLDDVSRRERMRAAMAELDLCGVDQSVAILETLL